MRRYLPHSQLPCGGCGVEEAFPFATHPPRAKCRAVESPAPPPAHRSPVAADR